MILALDNGLENLGWSVIAPRTGRVIALGLIHQKHDPEVIDSVSRAMRVHAQAQRLAIVARLYRCTSLVGEAMSFGGPPKARFAMAISLGLSWGVAAALAAILGLRLFEVPPKVWQRAILDIEAGAVDYEQVETLLAQFITGEAVADLQRIKKKYRNHPLDSVGVGVFGAVRPELLTPIAGPEDLAFDDDFRKFHEERVKGATT